MGCAFSILEQAKYRFKAPSLLLHLITSPFALRFFFVFGSNFDGQKARKSEEDMERERRGTLCFEFLW